ncbi:MAG: reverse transcriptase/maturase family protein [Patescibacteria group bacterium]|jgi:retron-type reverse transcriptase|nr:reverse transcriptase/maturase family protein [Patescibacteria group bacterium]
MFDKICSFQNLYSAYLKARKAKRYRPYILEFNFNLEENLLNLQKDLLNLTYQPGPYRQFTVCDSKKRLIKAPAFRDRIIHHALCNVIEPIFDRGFIFDSYACRKNKGTHRAVKRLGNFIKSLKTRLGESTTSVETYCLKCDVSKYFENIDHNLLLGFIAKKIKDKRVFWLIKRIIESDSPGIPIGNLTSQLFANIYLNELDQFIKHYLREKYYLRYMDDFLILDINKKRLHQIKRQIQKFLRDKLRLELHPKKANIFPINKGIDFLGYKIFFNYRLLRKNTVKRFIRRLKKHQQQLKNNLIKINDFKKTFYSWLVYAQFGKSWRLIKDLKFKERLCSIHNARYILY